MQSLFLIASMPIALIIYSLSLRDAEPARARVIAAIKGALAYLPAGLLYWLFLGGLAPSYEGPAYYGYLLVSTTIPLAMALGLFRLFYRYGGESGASSFPSLVMFLGGFMTAATLSTLVFDAPSIGFYERFILPAIRMAQIGLASCALMDFVEGTEPSERLRGAGLCALILLLPAADSLMLYNRAFLGLLVIAAAYGLGAWAYIARIKR
jgi:hypothetical protein